MTPEELKKKREKLKLTQPQLGEYLERTDRFIQYREGGDKPIDGMLNYAMKGLEGELKTKKKKKKK